MNNQLKQVFIGMGSILELFPTKDNHSYLTRLRQQPSPLSAQEAAMVNAEALHSDWQMVGNALRSAANNIGHHAA